MFFILPIFCCRSHRSFSFGPFVLSCSMTVLVTHLFSFTLSFIISAPCNCSTGREVEESFVYHKRDMNPANTGWAHRGLVLVNGTWEGIDVRVLLKT